MRDNKNRTKFLTFTIITTTICPPLQNPADKENIGPIRYAPSQVIKANYFPYTNQPGYLSPFVMVNFEQPARGVLINVECKAWAANIKHDRQDREGSVHFKLLID